MDMALHSRAINDGGSLQYAAEMELQDQDHRGVQFAHEDLQDHHGILQKKERDEGKIQTSLERILDYGHMLKHLEAKTLWRRFRIAVESASRERFGGVLLEDLSYRFPIALTFVVFFGVTFAYLFTTTLLDTENQKFLSPNKNLGKADCKTLSKQITGKFQADLDGYWETSKNFRDHRSFFVLQFSGHNTTMTDYQNAITYFQKEVDVYAKYAPKRSMFWSLAILSSLNLKHKDSGLSFCLSADASFFSNNKMKVTTLANERGICTGYNPIPNVTANTYVNGNFAPDTSSMNLQLPIRVNPRSVIGDASTRNFSITFSPASIPQEPCKQQGKWLQNLFWGADSQYRDGWGELGFDVRSTMLAVALNLGRVSTSSLVQKRSILTDTLGLIGLVDPYYDFPPMARIYCVDKGHKRWSSYKFKKAEIQEQHLILDENPSAIPIDYIYPNICFVVTVTKTAAIQLFYPMISSLKNDRLPCWNDVKGCPPKTPLKKSYFMNACKCPDDIQNVDCNRQSLYVGYFYDTDFPSAVFSAKSAASARLNSDRAVKMGINVQREMVMKIDIARQSKSSGAFEYDQDVLDAFVDVFAKSVALANNPSGRDLLQKDGERQVRTGQELSNSFRKLTGKYVNSSSTAPIAPVSAVIFRSIAITGYGNVIIPINRYNVQLQDVILKGAEATKSKYATYFERYANISLPSVTCANSFSFKEALQKMKSAPPVSLNEPYYSCTKNKESTLVVALGSAYSSTNVLASITWAVIGYLCIMMAKSNLKTNKEDPRAIVSHHTKRRLEELHQVQRDEKLLGVINLLLKRIEVLEQGNQVHNVQGTDEVEEFRRMFNLKRSEAADRKIAEELAKLAKKDSDAKDEDAKNRMHVPDLSGKRDSRPELEGDNYHGQYETQENYDQEFVEEANEREWQYHQEQVQDKPHWREQLAVSRRDSQRPQESAGISNETPSQPQRDQPKLPQSSPGFDPQVVAANLRRLSQKGGFSMQSAGSPAPLLKHPMATVLSGMTPPTATDLRHREKK